MRSRCASFVLVITVWAAGATAAAQVAAPPSPQPVPQGTTSTPVRPAGQPQTASGVSRPGATAADLGPIIANGNTAAYVSAESTGHPVVFIGSDSSPHGIVGTFSNHPLGFRTNNVARMFIDTSGNVGIGMTMPGYKLDVSGDANITGTYRVNGVPISATTNWTQAGNNIYYTSGNVGIGTTSPSSQLHVRGTKPVRILGDTTTLSADESVDFFAYSSIYASDLGGMRIQHQSTGNVDTLFYAAKSGSSASQMMTITGDGNVGIPYPTTTARLYVNSSISSNDAVVAVSTCCIAVKGDSYAGSGVSGHSFDGNGVVGVSEVGAGVYGQSSFGYAGNFQGLVDVTGNINVTGIVCAVNTNCASDARLKQNITPLSYGLSEVLRLRPVRWQWKDPTTAQLNLGLVAQEVEPVLPELILRNVDTKGSLGLNYMGFVPVMIKAIQEQQDLIATLKTENANLDARIRALEQALLQSQAQR